MAKKRVSRKEIFSIIYEIEAALLRIRRKSIFTFITYDVSNISGFATYSERFFVFASKYFQGLKYDYESPKNSEEVWFWLYHPATDTFANDLLENLHYYTDKTEDELNELNEKASKINKTIDEIEKELEKVKSYLLK